MKDCSPIVVLGPADKFEGQPDSHMNVKDIKIVVSGEPIHRDIVKCCVLKTFGTRFAGLFKKAFSLAEGDRTSFDSCVSE